MKTIARFVGVAMVLGLVAGAVAPASAAMTQAEMTAMIATLQAQLATLTGTTTTTTTTTSTTFTMDLTVGSRGTQVVALQNWLIAKGYLAAGNNTGYFGGLTQAAVAKWQMTAGITPAAGYFGPKSRAAANAAASTGTTTTTGGTTTTTTTSTLSGGDGDFDDFDVLSNPDNEDVEEGSSEQVFGFEFDAEDSDLSIERVNLIFSSTSRPWKSFESITLYNGSKKVSTIDASSSGDWDEDADEYSISFNDISVVVKEGENAKFYVEVEAQDSIDTSDLGEWTVYLDGDTDAIRAKNAEGVNVYEGSDQATTFDFTVIDSEVNLSVDDEDNEDMEVEVDEDEDTDNVTIYTAEFESEDGDNTINEVEIDIASTTASTDIAIADMVGTVYLFIDGKEVASESVSGLATSTVTFEDFDEVTVDEDDTVSIVIKADINEVDGNYTSGDGLFVESMTVTYEDANDDESTVTADEGGEITFTTDAINISSPTTVVPTYLANDESKGVFTINFKVTAPDSEDIYLPLGATTTATTGVAARYQVLSTTDSVVTNATSTNAYITNVSGATSETGFLKIEEGNTATIKLTVELSNTGNAAQSVKVGLVGVNYKAGSTSATTETYTAGLDEDFRTEPFSLQTSNTSI